MFSSGRCRFAVPGIGTIQGFCASRQASAIRAGVGFFRSAILPNRATKARLVVSLDPPSADEPGRPVALKHQSDSDFSEPGEILLTVQIDSRSVRAGTRHSTVIRSPERLGGVP